MIANVGRKDAQVRIVAGVLFCVASFVYSPWLALFGVFLIASALAERCIIYKLLNISTYQVIHSSFRYK